MRSSRSASRVALALAVVVVLTGCAGATGSSVPSEGQPAASRAPSGLPSAPATATQGPPRPTVAPGTVGPAPTATPGTTPTPGLRVGEVAYVAVTVATGWHSAASPRDVDAPALGNPARIREWLAGLSASEQAGLIGRVDTQVLLGDQILVTELTGAWARVEVPDQATPLDARGYPVWIPRVQLTAVGPAAPPASMVATIIVPTAWLEDERGARLAEASIATRLPVLATVSARVQVALPGGGAAWLPAASVSVRPRDEPALTPTSGSVVATARQFVGLLYLWGGTSGFGVDCSGFAYLVYRVHGVTIPRDAAPQSQVGTAIAAASRQPGDLVFFARNGEVHHVAIWMGGGVILEAPSVGARVREAVLAGLPYAQEVSGSRRLLG